MIPPYVLENSLVQPIVTFVAALIALWSIWYTQRRFDQRQKKDHEKQTFEENRKALRGKAEEIFIELSECSVVVRGCYSQLEAKMFHLPGGESIGDQEHFDSADQLFRELTNEIKVVESRAKKQLYLTQLYFPEIVEPLAGFQSCLNIIDDFLAEYRQKESDILERDVLQLWQNLDEALIKWIKQIDALMKKQGFI